MKKLFCLITALIFLIQSCNKDGFKSRYTRAYGIVTDSESGEPLSEVKLEIKKMIFETSGYTLEETDQYTYTDQNGYYTTQINLSGKPAGTYLLIIVSGKNKKEFTVIKQ